MSHIKRILVPTDFSAEAELAMAFAIDLARKYKGALHLIHVTEDSYLAYAYPDGFFTDLPDIQQKLHADAEQRLKELSARCAAANVPVTIEVLAGRPARMIIETAEAMGTDIIVMGTHGRGGVAHFIMGSVAEHVVRTALCPVFTVRDTARAADLVAERQRASMRVSA